MYHSQDGKWRGVCRPRLLLGFLTGDSHGDGSADNQCLSYLPIPACTSRGAGFSQWPGPGNHGELLNLNYITCFPLICFRRAHLKWMWSPIALDRTSPGSSSSAPPSWTACSPNTPADRSPTPCSVLSSPSSPPTSRGWGRPKRARIFTAGWALPTVVLLTELQCQLHHGELVPDTLTGST